MPNRGTTPAAIAGDVAAAAQDRVSAAQHHWTPPGGISTEELTTEDGLWLRARRWHRQDPKALVVVVHGFAASSHDGSVVRQAEALHDAGYEVVSYDSRGHGGSDGLCTLGDLERLDVAAAVDWVRTIHLAAAAPSSAPAAEGGRGGSGTRPIVVLGASMGAISVLRYAATAGCTPDGVVAISCPAAWRAPRSAQGLFATALTQTRLGRHLAERRMRVRLSPEWTNPDPPTDLIARIEAPIALVHGQRDHFIKPTDAVELCRHARGPKRLDLVPGMGHAYDLLGVAPIVAAVDWVVAAGNRSATPAPLAAGV